MDGKTFNRYTYILPQISATNPMNKNSVAAIKAEKNLMNKTKSDGIKNNSVNLPT